MLSTDDLAFVQGAFRLLRTTPCQILRKVSVSDGMGGVTDTWNVISAPDLLCRVAPQTQRGQETAVEGRLQGTSYWVIAFPPGQDVGAPDRITALGNTYEVDSPLSPRTSELERKMQCVLLQ